ncbi:sigma-70 RNA polymerase sigma factor region 4 domain-containing protein [Loigolactobacillus binensis]|uniref:Sigma-70 family RNA polymerase sigma factor n=1 Tax=Loigolactobacillus binensis TaxID=2559922 RepID=A0ABW3EHM2_9LACO|nr:sigma-70 family RNA polymerase sigma factor [Loigolactobacillus binensis]
MNEDLRVLILTAATGDSRACEQLFSRYRPMLKKIQQHYYLRDFDDDDWDQEARIVCFRAAQNYRWDTNLTFGRYYQKCLLCRVYSLIRRQSAQKRVGEAHTVSMENEDIRQCIEAKGTQQSLDLALILTAAPDFLHCLSTFEYQIFCRFVLSSLNSQCEQVDLSDSQTRNALERCRYKLKRYLNDHFFH